MTLRSLAAVVLVSSLATRSTEARDPLAVGGTLDGLEKIQLRDVRYASTTLADLDEAVARVVVFLDSSCAAVGAALPVLRELHAEHASRGVIFVGVHANDRESIVEVAAHAVDADLPFEVYKDTDQSVKARLGVTRTPEALVLDDDWKLRYRGAVAGDASPLRTALLAVLSGKPVVAPEVPSAGCLVRRPRPVRGARLTWADHAAPILGVRCVPCHSASGSAPFTLASLAAVRDRRVEIAEQLRIGRMPPAPRDPRVGRFENHAPLTPKERVTLLGWLAEGDIDRAESTLVPGGSRVEDTNRASLESQLLAVERVDGEIHARYAVRRGDDRRPLLGAVRISPRRGVRGLHGAELRVEREASEGDATHGASRSSHVTLGLLAPGHTVTRAAIDAPIEHPAAGALVLLVRCAESTPLASLRDGLDVVLEPERPAVRRTAFRELVVERGEPAQISVAAGEVLRAVAILGGVSLRSISLVVRTDSSEDPLIAIPAHDPRWPLVHRLAESGRTFAHASTVEAAARFDGEGRARVLLLVESAR